MASYLSTGWEISTLHTILLKPHSGVFVRICSHGGCIGAFQRKYYKCLTNTQLGSAGRCACSVAAVAGVERGGGIRRKGKEVPHFLSQLFAFAFISPHPLPLSFLAPVMQAACFVVAVIMTSSQFR